MPKQVYKGLAQKPTRILIFLLMIGVLGTGLLKAQESAPGSSSERIPIQLMEMPIDGVIQLYQRLTGRQIVQGQNLSGPTITLKTIEPVTREEAVRLLESAMLLHGYAVVPSGPNTVKILNTAAQNPRSEGLPIFTDVSQLPPTDQVVSFFLNLDHIPVSEAVSAFQAAIGQNPYTVILPVENNQSVIVTEKTPVIRQLVRLKELIDTPEARMVREFVQLNRADAEKVVEQLESLLESPNNRQGRTAGQAKPNPSQQKKNSPLPPEVTGQQANNPNAVARLSNEDVKFIPDARTNRILVVAPQTSFDYIKQLILDFDSAVDFSSPLNRPLRYVKAGDILPVLGEILAEGDDEVDITDAEGESATETSGGGGGGDSLSRPDRLSESGLESAPQSLTVGKTRIIADRRNNSILIMGPPENINRATAILDSLDVPAQQVFLSTVIGQVTLDDNTEFGVDILQRFERNGDFGGAAQNVTQGVDGGSFIDPTTLLSTGAFPGASAGMVLYGTFADTLDVFVRALKTTNNFEVLSRPTVFTTNNKKAVILSGRREPIPTQSLSSLNTTNNINSSVTTNVDFEDVVLKLEVIPLINSDNEITLTIAQQNDSLSGARIIGGNSVPIINTQELVTTVTMNNRNTVILGGLIEDSAQDETTGIPILGDLPLVGNLFKTTSRSRPRRELVIMVQPEIVQTIDQVTPASNRRVGESFVGPDTMEFSERGGANRAELNSMWRMKRAAEGPVPPRAEPVFPQQTYSEGTPEKPEPQPTTVPEVLNPNAILVQPRGIEPVEPR